MFPLDIQLNEIKLKMGYKLNMINIIGVNSPVRFFFFFRPCWSNRWWVVRSLRNFYREEEAKSERVHSCHKSEHSNKQTDKKIACLPAFETTPIVRAGTRPSRHYIQHFWLQFENSRPQLYFLKHDPLVTMLSRKLLSSYLQPQH